jgi:hypothetical protein
VKKNKFIDIQEKWLDSQSCAIYDDKNNSHKTLHILKDNASDVQVDDIGQATI